jgi:hypothetical protein
MSGFGAHQDYLRFRVMAMLCNHVFTAAETGTLSPNNITCHDGVPKNAVIQANFTYGSGGTTLKAWVQTSLDYGASWLDIHCFSFTQTSVVNVVNLSALTSVTTPYVPTDGALAANTAKDGILGPLFRAKTTSTGTYAANTTLRIDLYLPGVSDERVAAA